MSKAGLFSFFAFSNARFILAIWGIETNYGTYIGSFPVISSLTTLAYNGRRGKFFRRQLLDAIEIIDKEYIELENMIGSWAGAMGQSQFMPSSYLEYAQDYDKDGKKDIWSNYFDVGNNFNWNSIRFIYFSARLYPR